MKKKPSAPSFGTLLYAVDGRVATITLNRPERLNAIDDAMPGEIAAAVEAANLDERVHVIVLQGAGAAFCAGYDLKHYAEGDATHRYTQAMPWDPMRDYRFMKNWEGTVEGRMLDLTDLDERKIGSLITVYRHFGENLKVGVGYNFTDFSDDLTDLSYDHQGVFFNIVGSM